MNILYIYIYIYIYIYTVYCKKNANQTQISLALEFDTNEELIHNQNWSCMVIFLYYEDKYPHIGRG